ncbi:MAG TPA: hypothetical protein VIO61_14065 [Anaerolineaceae bacterium]
MKKSLRFLFTFVAIFVLIAMGAGGAAAAPTTKTLSTTYTVANMGGTEANVLVAYYSDSGGTWNADAGNTSFKLAANGGQKEIRQYFDGTMTSGRGSAVISSDQPLAAITLVLARGQTPTSGGYNGFAKGDTQVYVPQILKNRSTSNGIARQQLVIQNMDNKDLFVRVEFYRSPTNSVAPLSFTKNFPTAIKPGASLFYDTNDEAGLTDDWVGSAVVTARDNGSNLGAIGVVSNTFIGSDLLYTFSAFPSAQLKSKWFVPYFTSKLANGQNTSVIVQNLSGGDIAANDLVLSCAKTPGTSGNDTYTFDNGTTVIADKASFDFNTLNAGFPATWSGACNVTTLSGNKNIAVLVAVRMVGNPGDGGGFMYEGIPQPTGGDVDKFKTITVPYVTKRLANGGATVIRIQNIGDVDTTVTLNYKAGADYGGTVKTLTKSNIPLKAGEALVRNLRWSAEEPDLPDQWFGSLTVTSSAAPLQEVTVITNVMNATGDTYFGLVGFPLP